MALYHFSAKVISRMVDLVMIRTFGQDKIVRFAEHSRVPVINGLTNEFHPCQILADIFTYIEHRGSIRGRVVAWVGETWQEQVGSLVDASDDETKPRSGLVGMKTVSTPVSEEFI